MRTGETDVGVELSRLAGWRHTEADWRRMRQLSPEGLFVALYKGALCGTVAATCYGRTVGWVGMLLVHPDYRRRGIGSALMSHCVAYLRGQGVGFIKIDATPQGRNVYLRLGFEDERPVQVFMGHNLTGWKDALPAAIPPETWPAIADYDRAAFGADRLELLKLLGAECLSTCLTVSGQLLGYGFARPGHGAALLGPVVAQHWDAAQRIVTALLVRLPEGPVVWNLLPDNVAAKETALSLGFCLHDRITRMYLGAGDPIGTTDRLFGTAGLELG